MLKRAGSTFVGLSVAHRWSLWTEPTMLILDLNGLWEHQVVSGVRPRRVLCLELFFP
jgi:hypothetical protein